MKNPKTLSTYVNNFRRYLAPHLRPGVALATEIVPTGGKGGAVSVFFRPEGINRDDLAAEVPSVSDFLRSLGTELPSATARGGTTVMAAPERILFIKADDGDDSWGEAAARRDAETILAGARR